MLAALKVLASSVAELSEQFDVSEVTIRQDLQSLSEQGLLLRTRGGALATNVLPELSFDLRQQQFADRKAAIGREATHFLQNEDVIFIDASTTAAAMIPYLRTSHLSLTVLTNSLKVAMGLLGAPRMEVIIPGGRLRRESISLAVEGVEEPFGDMIVRVGFFGARGFTSEHGLTDQLKRPSSSGPWWLTANRLWHWSMGASGGQVASMTFAGLDDIDAVVTDETTSPELIAEIREHGIDVRVV